MLRPSCMLFSSSSHLHLMLVGSRKVVYVYIHICRHIYVYSIYIRGSNSSDSAPRGGTFLRGIWCNWPSEALKPAPSPRLRQRKCSMHDPRRSYRDTSPIFIPNYQPLLSLTSRPSVVVRVWGLGFVGLGDGPLAWHAPMGSLSCH